MKIKFSIRTLGCKVNQYEEQILRENLLRIGFEEAEPRNSDVFILNSCTVTAKADSKTTKMIRKVKRENPGVKIFVTGCYAVTEEDKMKLDALSEVDAVVPGDDKNKLPQIICTFFGNECRRGEVIDEVSGFSTHARAFLKVQDGCDQKCAYCKVNIVRGYSRSRSEGDVLEEVARLYGNGYREIVLTGICLGGWRGQDGRIFSDLLKEVDAIDGNFRIRLSSIEPNYVTEPLISRIAESKKICRHLHIPLQSGSDRVLRRMNRQYTAGSFKDLVRRLRKKIPLMGLTTDIIAGFPGETTEEFEETLRFVREVKPSRAHVFRYSDRKGTPAFEFTDKVPSDIARDRVERLISTTDILQKEFLCKFKGKEVEVLVETSSENMVLEGYTGEYVRVKVRGFDGTKGDLLTVTVNADGMEDTGQCLQASNTVNPDLQRSVNSKESK